MFRKIGFKVALFVNLILLVVIIGGTAFLVVEQERAIESQFKERAKFISVIGAKAVGRVMEEAIDNGVLTVEDAFDTDYVLIPGFDPPKYHTKYDSYTDKAFLTLQDEFLKDKNVLYAGGVDINGYIPTHNTRFQNPITGDKEKDRAGNRTKRVNNDTIGLKAAKNQEEGFLQVYKMDTGETTWDTASPIYVKGKHWGNFRVGISLDTLEKSKASLRITLGIVMLMILLLTTVIVFIVVNVTLKPLTEFTQIASRMADGDVENKIVSRSRDEIGELADVLERMRISLKTAMDRLTRQ